MKFLKKQMKVKIELKNDSLMKSKINNFVYKIDNSIKNFRFNVAIALLRSL